MEVSGGGLNNAVFINEIKGFYVGRIKILTNLVNGSTHTFTKFMGYLMTYEYQSSTWAINDPSYTFGSIIALSNSPITFSYGVTIAAPDVSNTW